MLCDIDLHDDLSKAQMLKKMLPFAYGAFLFCRLKSKLRSAKVPKSRYGTHGKLKETLLDLQEELERNAQHKEELHKAIRAEERLVFFGDTFVGIVFILRLLDTPPFEFGPVHFQA